MKPEADVAGDGRPLVGRQGVPRRCPRAGCCGAGRRGRGGTTPSTRRRARSAVSAPSSAEVERGGLGGRRRPGVEAGLPQRAERARRLGVAAVVEQHPHARVLAEGVAGGLEALGVGEAERRARPRPGRRRPPRRGCRSGRTPAVGAAGSWSATNRSRNSTHREMVAGPRESMWVPLIMVTHTSGLSSRAGMSDGHWPPVCSSCRPPTRNTGTSMSSAHWAGDRSSSSAGLRSGFSR